MCVFGKGGAKSWTHLIPQRASRDPGSHIRLLAVLAVKETWERPPVCQRLLPPIFLTQSSRTWPRSLLTLKAHPGTGPGVGFWWPETRFCLWPWNAHSATIRSHMLTAHNWIKKTTHTCTIENYKRNYWQISYVQYVQIWSTKIQFNITRKKMVSLKIFVVMWAFIHVVMY